MVQLVFKTFINGIVKVYLVFLNENLRKIYVSVACVNKTDSTKTTQKPFNVCISFTIYRNNPSCNIFFQLSFAVNIIYIYLNRYATTNNFNSGGLIFPGVMVSPI